MEEIVWCLRVVACGPDDRTAERILPTKQACQTDRQVGHACNDDETKSMTRVIGGARASKQKQPATRGSAVRTQAGRAPIMHRRAPVVPPRVWKACVQKTSRVKLKNTGTFSVEIEPN
jgi:hypothetical protein